MPSARHASHPPLLALAALAVAAIACDQGVVAPRDADPSDADAPAADTSGPDAPDTLSDTAPDTPDTSGTLETTPDDTTADTTPDTALPTEPALVDELAAGAWRWVIVVGPQTLVASDGDTIQWRAGDGALAVAAPGLSTFAPPAAAALSPREVLLGGADGLTRLIDGEVTASPLVDRFAGEPVTALAIADGSVWIGTAASLSRWREGVLTPISAGIDLGGDLLAAMRDGAWLCGTHGTSRLSLSPGSLILERPSLTSPPVVALGLDRLGHLYVLGDRVEVRAPGATARWLEAELPAPSQLVTHPEAPAAWVVLDDGLARGVGDSFARVAPLPPAFRAIRHAAAHADGRVVVATATGLFEVSASRSVSLPPLPSPLATSLTVTVRASDPAELTSGTATVTGGADPLSLPVALVGTGAERRLSVTLDPYSLPNGPLTLTLAVTWSDDETATTSSQFSVAMPTWTTSVAPFFERHCKSCHSADNGGNFASLHTPDRWVSRMDEILCRVDQHGQAPAPECDTLGFAVASMPPGRTIATPLVEMLRMWRDAGFRP